MISISARVLLGALKEELLTACGHKTGPNEGFWLGVISRWGRLSAGSAVPGLSGGDSAASGVFSGLAQYLVKAAESITLIFVSCSTRRSVR